MFRLLTGVHPQRRSSRRFQPARRPIVFPFAELCDTKKCWSTQVGFHEQGSIEMHRKASIALLTGSQGQWSRAWDEDQVRYGKRTEIKHPRVELETAQLSLVNRKRMSLASAVMSWTR